MPNEITNYDPADLGEAMQVLTDTQRRYVIALVTQGGQKANLAYQLATGCTPENANKNAWRMNVPHVMAAIREEADRRLRSGAILGASVLVDIAEDTQHKDRFKAASRLLDHAGLIVATEHKVTVEDRRSTDEILKSIARIASENKLDLGQVIKDAVVDADFEVIENVKPDMTGLEDI